MALPNGTHAIKDNEIIRGNPTLTRLDGDERAPLEIIIDASWTKDKREAFGVYLVDTTPPAGKRWAGTFADNAAVFEDLPPPTAADVNREALRRIQAGFPFGGVAYDFDPKSQARITGAATLAGFAMGAGAQAGNYFWADPAQGFAWIAQDNSVVPMDAPTCFAFGQAAAGHESAHVFAAFALKAWPESTPADFADDKYWP